ncbi:outer membrane lipoprotein carrier protein LolA [Armatimonas sp.]|uniref:LolA family protein n=1 Tax=Armatimonas sp. TaxID=1872638 RepID=UPI0037501A51
MQKAPQLKNTTKLALSRANLAKTAQFTVTTVMAPKSGPKDTQVFQVAVSGAKARMDYKDKALGEVRYVVNEKGTFFFIPANKAAQKMNLKIEDGLNTVFSQASEVLAGAQKTGKATVAGIACDIYTNPRTGSVVYLGTTPGFTLPVKLEIKNVGGVQTMQASQIKLNGSIPAAHFALPAGTQVIEGQGGPTGLPGSR